MNNDNHHINRLEKKFNDAVELHQQGKLEKACIIYEEILVELPHSPLLHYNLGLAMYECENYSKSCDHYQQALKLAPDEIDIIFNLALSLKKANRFEEAINYYEKILLLKQDDIDTLYNLGCLYKDSGDTEKALDLYNRVLEISPEHLSSLNNSAYLYHSEENYEMAASVYKRILKLSPNHPSASFMLDTLEGKTSKAAPTAYLKEIFDSYSSRYDHSLVEELEYRVPEMLKEKLCGILADGYRAKLAMDLGCGTGLGAKAFSELFDQIHGVDISERMVEIASSKNIYSRLHVADLQSYLDECDSIYQLIIATDVFSYIGELEDIFNKIKKVSAPKAALFCFSVELSKDNHFSLQKSGRFAHSDDYISGLCQKADWNILSCTPANLRKDKEKWVKGTLYILKN